MVKLGKYSVIIERDPESGWWLGTIEATRPDLQGMTTQGKTLPTLRARVREMLALEAADAAKAEITFTFRRKADAGEAIRVALAARDKARKASKVHADAQAAQKAAARALAKAGIGIRDAAELLGVSYQRVHQLAGAT